VSSEPFRNVPNRLDQEGSNGQVKAFAFPVGLCRELGANLKCKSITKLFSSLYCAGGLGDWNSGCNCFVASSDDSCSPSDQFLAPLRMRRCGMTRPGKRSNSGNCPVTSGLLQVATGTANRPSGPRLSTGSSSSPSDHRRGEGGGEGAQFTTSKFIHGWVTSLKISRNCFQCFGFYTRKGSASAKGFGSDKDI
jgi:hypothetical protein